MQVRWVGAEDWEALRDVRLASLADSPAAFTSTLEREQAYADDVWQSRAAAGNAVVAEDGDGTLVGIAGLYPDPDGTPHAELFGMWVAPDARGTGVAGALVAEIVARAKSRGLALSLSVMPDNERAIRFYRRAGFRDSGIRDGLRHMDLP